jgi:hypothetical protein
MGVLTKPVELVRIWVESDRRKMDGWRAVFLARCAGTACWLIRSRPELIYGDVRQNIPGLIGGSSGIEAMNLRSW